MQQANRALSLSKTPLPIGTQDTPLACAVSRMARAWRVAKRSA